MLIPEGSSYTSYNYAWVGCGPRTDGTGGYFPVKTQGELEIIEGYAAKYPGDIQAVGTPTIGRCQGGHS